MLDDVARFLLERATEDLVRLGVAPADVPGSGPVRPRGDAAARELRHAQGRHEVAATWLRLSEAADPLLEPRRAELGRVVLLLAAAYADHPAFPGLAERAPQIRSGFPLW